jgi:serine/threonine protein kinase
MSSVDLLNRQVDTPALYHIDVVPLQRPPMMHRDLKSPNVLLSEEGVAKIADVGMVRSQVKDLVTAQPVMTPLWAAPEVGCCAVF